MVDPWSVGYHGIEEDEGRRLATALMFCKEVP